LQHGRAFFADLKLETEAPMDKIWLAAYPPGVPADIDPDQVGSLVDLLETAFRQYGPHPAFACMDRVLTYADLDGMSMRLAAWLQSRGMAQGARVAVMLPNVLQYPVALAAILRAGYTVVNVNPLASAHELERQLIDSGSEAIVVLENFAHTVAAVLPDTAVRHVVVASMGELLGARGAMVNFVVRHVKRQVPEFAIGQMVRFRDALAQGARMPFKPVRQQASDPAFLQYASSTDGAARGAVLTHRNVAASVLQTEAWCAPRMAQAPLADRVVVVCALPLHHMFALTACALWGMRTGAVTVLIPNPRDIRGLVDELGKYRVNVLPGVNALFGALLNDPAFRHLDFSHLKLCHGSGMAGQQDVTDGWQAVTGVPVVDSYGLAETAAAATCNGLPLPSTEVAIVDDAGHALPPGHVGEIAVRGPQVMARYWHRPEDTARATTADGFFRTGDTGAIDEHGCVKIVDRRKDMMLLAGFTIQPNEFDAAMAGQPDALRTN
jgi:long-chain acyl-CoA synthetase